MNRTSAIALVLTASGLIVAAPYVAESVKKDREDEQFGAQSPVASKGGGGEPRGFANSDFISPVAPYAADAQRDKIDRPYHLLIRVLRFDDLSLLDVDVGAVKVLGAKQVKRLSAGTYLASSLDIAITSVTIKNTPKPGGPGKPPQFSDLAMRNPVAMSRHAITTCEVIAVLPENLEETVEVRGVVYDRFTGETIAGAQVIPYGRTEVATADEQGRFSFPEQLTVLESFNLTLAAPGYRSFPVNPRSMTRTWLEAWRSTGEMTLTMASETEHRQYRPLLGGGGD